MIEWMLAGLWAEIWKWGLGVALIILFLAAAYFIPIGKRYFVEAAVIVAVAMFVYTKGVYDQHLRCAAQQKIVYRQVTAAVTYAKSRRALHARDPYNSPRN